MRTFRSCASMFCFLIGLVRMVSAGHITAAARIVVGRPAEAEDGSFDRAAWRRFGDSSRGREAQERTVVQRPAAWRHLSCHSETCCQSGARMAALQRRASPPFAHRRYKIELQLQMDEQNRRKEQVSPARPKLSRGRWWRVAGGLGWVGTVYPTETLLAVGCRTAALACS